jgi:DNA modification methylase
MLEVNYVYKCDYRDKIKEIEEESIDMILTDIPYLISKDTNFQSIKNHTKNKGKSDYTGMKYGEWDKQDDGDEGFNLKLYLEECCRILKPSRSIIVWSSWQRLKEIDDILKHCLKSNIGTARVGIWRKTNPSVFNMDKMAIQPFEFFIWNRKGSNWTFNNRRGKYYDLKGIERQHPEINYYEDNENDMHYFVERTIKGGHPNAKPLSIFEQLICTYTDEQDIVFDGCIGGGTTAIAAINSNRRYIGFEKDDNYYDMTQRNIAEAHKHSK